MSQRHWPPTRARPQTSDQFQDYQGQYNLSKNSGLNSVGGARRVTSRLLMPLALLSLFLASTTTHLQVNATSQDRILPMRTLQEGDLGAATSGSDDTDSGSLYKEGPTTEDTQDSQQHIRTSEIPQIRIDSIDPFAGPVTGDTRVIVRGGPFKADYQMKFPQPRCKFGSNNKVVNATYILCTTAPRGFREKEARHSERNEVCLQCDNAPFAENAGNIQLSISLRGDFLDNSNSKPYQYYPVPIIRDIRPKQGPKDGNTTVEIFGEGFIDFTNNTFCAFGTVAAETEFVNSTYIRCISPESAVVEKPIPVSVTLNNQQNTQDTINFWYYPAPTITELVPNKGPETGGTEVILKGSNFKPFQNMSIEISEDIFCLFKRLGSDGVKVRAYVYKSTIAMCISPASLDIKETEVEITLNNQQYSDDDKMFYYYRPPVVYDLWPREGPVQGGTDVIVTGANFLNTTTLKCKFGPSNKMIVKGIYLSETEVLCPSPPYPTPGIVDLTVSIELDKYSSPLKYWYYDNPEIEVIEPACGPDYGNTQIVVRGKNFVDLGHNKALCIFNKTIQTNATVIDVNTLVCHSPSLLNEQGYSMMKDKMIWYEFEVTINGGREAYGPTQKFFYYKDPLIRELIPNSGPISGGTRVRVFGSGFSQEGACNKFSRFSVFETSFSVSNDTEASVVSPPASTPDAVVFGVALNGEQYTRDITIHQRDPENTFEYYHIPLITGFEPVSGPNIGGTQVTIHGIGFTPRKDDQGLPDKTKNKMWIRFVDPDSKSSLAPSTEVKTDELSDDEAVWYTPALPANTVGLMQISLNSADWQDVPISGKTHSFTYFESPHISKLNPAFGPVKHKELLIMDIEGKNFKCPEATCSDLSVRFGEVGLAIYVKGQWVNENLIRVKVPRYTKPQVLNVELTLNGKDWTNDGLTYGYFDPFIIRAEPALASIDGTTKIKLIGFGFVNSKTSKSLVQSPTTQALVCPDRPCINDATFIDQYTMETQISPQSLINYKESKQNILWDPMTIDASIHGSNLADFTDNSVQVFFYEEPDYKEMSVSESPANTESTIFITTDFKKNPIDRLKKYANVMCRFKSLEDGSNQVFFTQGELTSYPLNRNTAHQPNAVTCKSPKWLLKGRDFEVARLDIALNGQDFKGDKLFTFTQDIFLHRSVPMSGPVQGGTRTNLIGTGFRTVNTPVNFKWGILSTEKVSKADVLDYLYQKSKFESWQDGFEGVKGYVYEASSFLRVDSSMEEGKSYHLYKLNSPRIESWTKTNGGPFYIEVGRDQAIKYLSGDKQAIGNATGVAPDFTKDWIYYDYDVSSVEFYHYKDCVIKEIQPHSGLITGGTKVTVTGAWFKYMPEYGVVPHCKFGDKIVRAQFDSTVRITCISPPGVEINTKYSFEVSLNGVDWSVSGSEFSYYEEPEISSIFPTIGPVEGGTEIFFLGKNFFNQTMAGEFLCMFTPINVKLPPRRIPAVYHNTTALVCPSPGGWGQGIAVKVQVTFNGMNYDNNNFTFTFYSITRAFPQSGPSDGTGNDIIIEGFGFRNDTNPMCRLDNVTSQPTYVSWRQIRCQMTRAREGPDYFGTVDFAVTPNGNDWHPFSAGFHYYPQPQIFGITPKQGPSVGEGIIHFFGKGFRNDFNLKNLTCHVGEEIGDVEYISDSEVQCKIDNLALVPRDSPLEASVALNGYSWTIPAEENKTRTQFTPYGIEKIYPNSGPVRADTPIIIQGKGFQIIDDEDGVFPRCRFGTPGNYAIVDASIISYERIQCRAPGEFIPKGLGTYPIDVPLSIAITKDEYDPWTESYQKFRFYEQPNIAKCDPCEVDVGTKRDIFVWAEEGSQFFEPIQQIELTQNEQDAEDNEILTPPNEYHGIKCSFGRFGTTTGTYVNSSVIICDSPSIADEPDSIYRETVQLTVALNGITFGDEVSELEFTFVGTGTYLSFWPFILGAILIAVLVMVLIQCCGELLNGLVNKDRNQTGFIPNAGNIIPHTGRQQDGSIAPVNNHLPRLPQ